MPKDSPWFRHDVDARHDPKLIALLAKHGDAGVNRWWTIAEILRSQDGYRLPVKSTTGIMLAQEWHIPPAEAEKLLDDLVELELIKNDGAWLWSDRMCRQMETLDNLRNGRSRAGQAGAWARWGIEGDPMMAADSGNGSAREGNAMEPTVVDPIDVEKMMALAHRRCTAADAQHIAEALGRHGGTVDSLAYALQQIKGPVKTPVGYVLSLIDRYGIVSKWLQAGKPEAPKPTEKCPECRVAAPYHAQSCSKLAKATG
jgi:hypothetical protein